MYCKKTHSVCDIKHSVLIKPRISWYFEMKASCSNMKPAHSFKNRNLYPKGGKKANYFFQRYFNILCCRLCTTKEKVPGYTYIYIYINKSTVRACV